LKKKWICAICASSTVLKAAGVGIGKKITSYPSFESEFIHSYEYSQERVVSDEFLITSRGPSTAYEFAFAMGNAWVGEEKTKHVMDQMLYINSS
jgi:putative intracellular protease/amidase